MQAAAKARKARTGGERSVAAIKKRASDGESDAPGRRGGRAPRRKLHRAAASTCASICGAHAEAPAVIAQAGACLESHSAASGGESSRAAGANAYATALAD